MPKPQLLPPCPPPDASELPSAWPPMRRNTCPSAHRMDDRGRSKHANQRSARPIMAKYETAVPPPHFHPRRWSPTSWVRANSHANTRTHAHTHIRTQGNTHTRTHTNACAHARTHARRAARARAQDTRAPARANARLCAEICMRPPIRRTTQAKEVALAAAEQEAQCHTPNSATAEVVSPASSAPRRECASRPQKPHKQVGCASASCLRAVAA